MAKKLRILLVWPYGFEKTYALPLALGYLYRSLQGTGHVVEIFDGSLLNAPASSPEFRKKLVEFKPDLVGVSAWSILFPEALSVLKVAKEVIPGVVTVMGGPHVTSHAQKSILDSNLDFIIRGEAEFSFPQFVKVISSQVLDFSGIPGLVWKGKIGVQMNPMETAPEMDEIPLPDYDVINLEEYWEHGYRYNTREPRNAPVWMTRGCPYKCTFCSAPFLNGRPVRTHSVEYLVKWVKYLYHEKNVRWINILDDNFTFNVKFAEEFCRAIIDLNLKDLGFGTPNGIRFQRGGPQLWSLMKKAGWRSLIIAPESGSPKVLKAMKKNLDLSLVPPAVKEIKRAGLTVQGLFLIGYPGETREDIKLTSEFIKRCRFNFIFLNVFQPLPGTPVYDELVARGEIKDGLLPNNYSEGTRSYVTKGLEGFNFPLFVLKTYILLAIRDPLNIPNLFSFFDPAFLAKKLKANIMGIFKGSARNAQVNHQLNYEKNLQPVTSQYKKPLPKSPPEISL